MNDDECRWSRDDLIVHIDTLQKGTSQVPLLCLRLSKTLLRKYSFLCPSFSIWIFMDLPVTQFAGITIDEFVESLMFMKSRAHPLDIVGIMRGMWLVYERMVNMHGMFEAVNAQLDECRDFLSPLLQNLGMYRFTSFMFGSTMLPMLPVAPHVRLLAWRADCIKSQQAGSTCDCGHVRDSNACVRDHVRPGNISTQISLAQANFSG